MEIDGDSSGGYSDEFYLHLHEQIDRIPGRNIVLLQGVFSVKVNKNRGRW